MWFPAGAVPIGLEEVAPEGMINIDPDVTSEQKALLLDVCRQCSKVFPSKDDKLGHSTVLSHKIETGDAKPVRQHLRMFSPAHRVELNQQVQEMLSMDVCEPCLRECE